MVKTACLFRSLVCVLLSIILCVSTCYAETSHTVKPNTAALLKQQLTRDQQRIAKQLAKFKSQNLAALSLNSLSSAINQAQADVETMRLNIASVQQELISLQSTIANINRRLQEANLNLNEHYDKSALQLQLEYLEKVYSNKQKQLALLNQTLADAVKIIELLQSRKDELVKDYQIQQMQRRLQTLHSADIKLQNAQTAALLQLANLQRQLANINNLSAASYERLVKQRAEVAERSNQYSIQLLLLRIELQLIDLSNQDILNTTDLNVQRNNLAVIANQLKSTQYTIVNKIRYLVEQESPLQSSNMAQQIIKTYRVELQHIQSLQYMLSEQQKTIEQSAKHSLAKRYGLPGLDWHAWLQFSQKLMTVPGLIILLLKGLGQELTASIQKMSAGRISLLLLVESIWLFIGLYLQRYLQAMLAKVSERQPWLSATVINLEMIKRNLPGLITLAGALTLLLLAHASNRILSLFLLLALTGLGFKLTLDLARISLLETIGNHTGLDVRLYYRLKWIFLTGAVLTVLLILVHQLPVDYAIGDFFNRLFMLFLLLIALLLLKGLWLVPGLIEPHLRGKPPYLIKAIRLLCLLFPLSLLITATIGLTGYVELAWRLSRYAGMCLIVLTGYLLARGVLGDIMRLLSITAIRQLRNGWLFNEAIFKPLDKLIKFALAITALFTAGWLNGWISKPMLNQLSYWLDYRLFIMAGGIFTPLTLVELISVIVIFIWLTRWMPEFAYRWLFSRVKDSGARNSLAIFSQYAVVITGTVIGLRIIGIDLGVLKFILGGLAVGVGFGLRDLANNFVSGILLLIERPVRKGDTVTIDIYEGQVTHIGMRSITVKTWDHTEVIVPNSEVFSRSFTNWTHQDNIVRITINLRVQRHDNPQHIRSLILQTLQQIEGVATEPAPEVYLQELDQGLLEFALHYYIHLLPGASRLWMRSKVLFAVYEQLQKEGLHPAHPQQDIYIKGVDEGLLEG